jgi:hypothetical protein
MFIWVYAAVMGMIPVLAGSFASFMRYSLMAYPLAWALDGLVEEKPRRRIWVSAGLVPAVLVQWAFILLHLNAFWIG